MKHHPMNVNCNASKIIRIVIKYDCCCCCSQFNREINFICFKEMCTTFWQILIKWYAIRLILDLSAKSICVNLCVRMYVCFVWWTTVNDNHFIWTVKHFQAMSMSFDKLTLKHFEFNSIWPCPLFRCLPRSHCTHAANIRRFVMACP